MIVMLAAIAVLISLLAIGCKKVDLNSNGNIKTDDVSGNIVKDTAAKDAASQTAAANTDKAAPTAAPAAEKKVIDIAKASSSDCADISLKLEGVDGGKPCIYSNTVTIVLGNSGERSISMIKLNVDGSKADTETLISGVPSASASIQIIRYDSEKYGSLDELRLTPIIRLDDGKEAACEDRIASETSISKC